MLTFVLLFYRFLSSIVDIVQPRENWTKQFQTSRGSDVSDLSTKGYLTRYEALRYEPLTNVNNVVSMQLSLTKVLG